MIRGLEAHADSLGVPRGRPRAGPELHQQVVGGGGEVWVDAGALVRPAGDLAV